jgi:hypothetical protein
VRLAWRCNRENGIVLPESSEIVDNTGIDEDWLELDPVEDMGSTLEDCGDYP